MPRRDRRRGNRPCLGVIDTPQAYVLPVLDRLGTDGYVVAEKFFPAELCQALQLEAEALSTDVAAIDAGIGRGATYKSDLGVRRARIRWVVGSTPAQAAFLATTEILRKSINELFYLQLVWQHRHCLASPHLVEEGEIP